MPSQGGVLQAIIANVSNANATELGALLRLSRKRAGLTQEEVGKAVGLTRTGYEALENGRTRNPSVDTLKALAAALNIPMTEIVVAVGMLGREAADPFTTLEELRVLKRRVRAMVRTLDEYEVRAEQLARSAG